MYPLMTDLSITTLSISVSINIIVVMYSHITSTDQKLYLSTLYTKAFNLIQKYCAPSTLVNTTNYS